MSAKDQKKGALVPRLRFPEFREVGEWEEIKLNNICDVLPGYGFPESLQGKQSGQYPFCKVSDISKAISDHGGLLKTSVNYIDDTELSLLRAKLIPAGSTVFAKIGEALRLNRRAICAVECVIDNNAVGIKAKYKKSTDYFLYILSQRIDLNEYCSGAVPSVNKTALENIDVLIPSIGEQQRIADCLSSLDERITAETSKLDTLKEHKKGLLKQLFSAEGETTPALRFPEFRDAGEWEEVPLSKLVSSLDAGVSVNAGDRPARSEEVGILKTSAVTNGVFEPQENKVVLDVVEIGRMRESVRRDTIIISRMNTPALVGANAYVDTSFENIFLPDRLWAAKPKSDTSMRFISFILGSNQGRATLALSAKGSSDSMKNITKSDVLAFLALIPSLPEQQRIAECLSSLDELITAQTQKIDLLKDHKKGLMQRLFPRIDEVRA